MDRFAVGGLAGGWTPKDVAPFQQAIDALPASGVNASWFFDFHIGGDSPIGREA